MNKLPLSDLKWLSESEIMKLEIMKINPDGFRGYIFEVDLEYPSNLHDLHNNFPLAPENVEITFENLSPYSKLAYEECNHSKKFSDVKLCSTFHTRKKYVIHLKNLQLYISLGLKLTKIWRAISFYQKNFIAPFIAKCTFARQNSISKFEQNQFKKVANSVYGKTIQNVRNYIEVKMHTKCSQLESAVSKHNFKNFTILGENLVQTNHFSEEIIHKQPIIIGFTILELVRSIAVALKC